MTRQTERDDVVYDRIWSNERLRPPSSTFATLIDESTATESGPRTMVDLGCGLGRHALYAANAGLDVIAIDHSKRAIECLRSQAGDLPVEVVEGDYVGWLHEQRPASVDVVVCFDSLHHVAPDHATIQDTLRHIIRVTRPGGHVLVTLLTNITYSTGEAPQGRFRITRHEAGELLTRAFAGASTLVAKSRDVYVPKTTSIDPRTCEPVDDAEYRSTRVLRLFRCADFSSR